MKQETDFTSVVKTSLRSSPFEEIVEDNAATTHGVLSSSCCNLRQVDIRISEETKETLCIHKISSERLEVVVCIFFNVGWK